jgi:hypothetical protein
MPSTSNVDREERALRLSRAIAALLERDASLVSRAVRHIDGTLREDGGARNECCRLPIDGWEAGLRVGMSLNRDVEFLLHGRHTPSAFACEAWQRRGARHEIHVERLSHVLGELVDPGGLNLSETFQRIAHSHDDSIKPGTLGIEQRRQILNDRVTCPDMEMVRSAVSDSQNEARSSRGGPTHAGPPPRSGWYAQPLRARREVP